MKECLPVSFLSFEVGIKVAGNAKRKEKKRKKSWETEKKKKKWKKKKPTMDDISPRGYEEGTAHGKHRGELGGEGQKGGEARHRWTNKYKHKQNIRKVTWKLWFD